MLRFVLSVLIVATFVSVTSAQYFQTAPGNNSGFVPFYERPLSLGDVQMLEQQAR
jgi:hypothetical protein